MPEQSLTRRSDTQLERKKKITNPLSTEDQPLLVPQTEEQSGKSIPQLHSIPSSSMQSDQQFHLPNRNRPIQLSGFSRSLFGKPSQQQPPVATQSQTQQQKRKSSAGWLRKLSGHTPTTSLQVQPSFDNVELKTTIEQDEVENNKDTSVSTTDAAQSQTTSDSKHGETMYETSKSVKSAEIKAVASLEHKKEVFEPSAPTSLDQGFDMEDLYRTQKSLLELKAKFDAGKLKVFETEEALNRMKQIQEQQERLARLHFELHATHSATDMYTQTARNASMANLKHLMSGLQTLKQSV